MLNGIDPIIIFQIYKLYPLTPAEKTLAKIPLTSTIKRMGTFAVIPIYLSETLTGILIDSESKSIDIDTKLEGKTDGSPADVTQTPLGSITSINLVAKQGSIGLTILLALSELILDKSSSQEYEITYMNGAVTVFGGLIHGFSYDQGRENDLYKIKLELSRGRPKTKQTIVSEDPTAERLPSQGTLPPANAPTVSSPSSGSSQSVIRPGVSQARS